MKIAFLDASGWDFTLDTPYERPLGGSQSALCYLAEAMAALGHEVRLLNGRKDPVLSRGVLVGWLNARASVEALRDFDAVVALNGIDTTLARRIRDLVGPKPYFVFWTQHAHDQPAVGNLRDAEFREVWDAYVLISDWQAAMFRATFGLPAERIRILRNAIGPAFAGRAPEPRPWPPVLAYTSTPFRGLDVLLDAFPRIRAAVPGTTLKVFSSMGVYQVAKDKDQYAGLYERCRTTEGVEYIGSVPQPQLVEALRGVTALAYPNTFPETSCISVMEALAAGCAVVTSELGALPETAAGWGHVLPVPADRDAFIDSFAGQVIDLLHDAKRVPERAAARMRQQVARLNATTTWPVRAGEWSDWLALCVARRGGAATGTLAERVTGTVPVAPPLALSHGRHGLFLSDARAAVGRSLQLYGEWLETTARTLCYTLRPGDRVVEIGAGQGGLTVPLARRVGPDGGVLAVEPDPVAFRLLCATLALNGLDWVEAVPDSAFERIDRCRLLVIGAERAAAPALDAAAALVARTRPFVLAPAGTAEAFAAVRGWADRIGYRLFWHADAAFNPDNTFRLADDVLGGAGLLGVLAVPAEAPTQIVGVEARSFAEAEERFPALARRG